MEQSILDAIAVHAQREYPKECCGLIVDTQGVQTYRECTNTIPESDDEKSGPKYNFAIAPEAYADAEDAGEITHIVHSHPDASNRPSKEDVARCNESGLPWLIMAWPTGDWRIVEPCDPELIGRDFVLGVYDCYGLVMDYYRRELNIELPDFRVSYPWWEQGENLYLDNFAAAGFVEVSSPQKHDVLLMQVQAKVVNHAAIMLDGNTMLHHLYGHKSGRIPYGGYYRERTLKIVRHQSLM